jgi:hypothetical protein
MFGWFRPRSPLPTPEKLWVEQRMSWLVRAFGPDRLLGAEGILPTAFGDYELLRRSRDGTGVVYKVRQVSLDRVVALKMILEQDAGSGEWVRRFNREARAAAALDHPNIVPVHDTGWHEGRHFFTMAYIEGRTSRKWSSAAASPRRARPCVSCSRSPMPSNWPTSTASSTAT